MATSAKLTETRIDLGDRHTTLYHFSSNNEPSPLALGDPDGYEELYWTLANVARDDYENLTNGRDASILHKLMPAYRGTKYWLRYLETDPTPRLVWGEGLPIEATLTSRISIRPPHGFSARVSPVPRVLLYPFGWSAWISIRITGEHTMAGLADLIVHLSNEQSFEISSKLDRTHSRPPLTLRQLFAFISDGVRNDVFGGTKTESLDAQQTAIVTTVMAKHGGSPALGALSPEDEALLKRMVRPEGAQSQRPLQKMVYRFDSSDLEYMVIDRLGRFTWMEHLLIPEARNHQLLGCYHNNSFMALIQAWQLTGLAEAGATLRRRPPHLQRLLHTAVSRLTNPKYVNASLKAFLDLDSVQSAITGVRKKR